ncbi:GNAT family N-acetyltransferase [Flavobacteriaceae bacterium]|nr:GNAT family N-acetyltransferase [Flavobacteriaceae bacterium]
MTGVPIIRFVKKTDIDDLVRLCEQHAVFERSAFDPKNKEEDLITHLFSTTPSLHCLIVENKDKIIGYATYMKQFSTWDAGYYIYMDCLFIKEASRGYGLGEKLIDKIKSHGCELGCSQIQWQTPEFNKRAMKFYDRIGANGKTKERYFLKINTPKQTKN